MTEIGFHASHEQFAPGELLRLAQRAAAAGFGALSCSDHFHPWTQAQGHSGHAFAWLGAALEATGLSAGTVCAPGYRYHPAVVAQAAATLADMYPTHFWLALGSGEYLNEHITGAPWPAKDERQERLQECAEVIRALWRGEEVTHRGRVVVEEAKLYSLPKQPPLLLAAALTEETARRAGQWADGLITIAAPPEELKRVRDAFLDGGGRGRPLYLKVDLSFAQTDACALSGARQQWAACLLEPELLSDLRTPAQFEAAAELVDEERVRSRLRVSSSAEQHVEWLSRDIELGFTRLLLHNVNPWQEQFIDAFAEKVLPKLSSSNEHGRAAG